MRAACRVAPSACSALWRTNPRWAGQVRSLSVEPLRVNQPHAVARAGLSLRWCNTGLAPWLGRGARRLHRGRTVDAGAPHSEDSTAGPATEDGEDDESEAKKSKVEKLLATVRAQREEEVANRNFVQLVEDVVDKKRTKPSLVSRYPIHTAQYRQQLWKDLTEWAHHMKMGSKLLWTETKIASKLLMRLFRGGALTRRERQQFVRTLSDLLRLVPFSLFVIIPFAEFALPLALRIFPNLLPSTFQEAEKEEAKRVAELKVKLEMATFLQETVEEMAAKRKGDISDDLRSFLRLLEKGRSGAGMTQTSELLKYSALFDDVLTLDSLNRRQLIALNRLLLLPTIGTDGLLNMQIRYRLKRLHADDLLIRAEGVDSLSVPELQAACRERGMRALGISEEGLRSRLEQWLHLNLDAKVPASLLLLTRILYLPESMDTSEQIAATIEQMPDTLKRAAKMAAVETEGGEITAQDKLELIEEQQEKIEAEHSNKLASKTTPPPDPAEYEDEHGFKVSETPKEKITIPDLSDEELSNVTMALHTVAKAEKDPTTVFEKLKSEHLENVQDMKELASEKEIELPRASVILSKQVSKMLKKVEGSVLSESRQSIEFDLNNDGLITTDEILSTLKKTVSKENEISLRRLINVIDTDHDGVVRVETLQKIMDAIHEEGMESLMKLEGDASLNMVVEAIEREEKAKSAINDGKKKKKKTKRAKKVKDDDTVDEI